MKNGVQVTMLFFLVLWGSVSCSAQTSDKLSPEAFKQKIASDRGDFVILDVRTDEEVAQGMIKGAQQLDFNSDNFMEELGELDSEVTYYVYCAGGGRSGSAVSMMAEMGFTKVYDLKGGMNAWLAAGYKVKK